MIHVKYCLRCLEAFDLGTNFDICPFCRRDDEKKREEDEKRERLKWT